MLEFRTWQELVIAYLRASVPRFGWRVHGWKRASTGTVYVDLRRPGGRAKVRVSDHRSYGLGGRIFSVRQRGTGKLRELGRFLASVPVRKSV